MKTTKRERRIQYILDNQSQIGVSTIDFPVTRALLEGFATDELEDWYNQVNDLIAEDEELYQENYIKHGRAE